MCGGGITWRSHVNARVLPEWPFAANQYTFGLSSCPYQIHSFVTHVSSDRFSHTAQLMTWQTCKAGAAGQPHGLTWYCSWSTTLPDLKLLLVDHTARLMTRQTCQAGGSINTD